MKRRDFLYVATGTVAAIGLGLSAWPLVEQWEPSADVVAAGSPVTIDISSLETGQQITVIWRNRPIFIVRRSLAMLDKLRSPSLLRQLRDPNSRELQQPPYAANWCRSSNPEYLVVVGVCTHLGCIPTFEASPDALGTGWPGGYLCHCHGSRYDLAGRVFKGVPAPYNLPVPPYRFVAPKTLMIGENPDGETFQLSSVEQI